MYPCSADRGATFITDYSLAGGGSTVSGVTGAFTSVAGAGSAIGSAAGVVVSGGVLVCDWNAAVTAANRLLP